MKSLGQSPIQQEGRSLAGLDGLLSVYFQREMPQSWPGAKPATEIAGPGQGLGVRSRTRFRSRLVLAASLVIFLLGQLILSAMSTGLPPIRSDRELGRIEATKRTREMPTNRVLPAPR
jgi:hypothetical protein